MAVFRTPTRDDLDDIRTIEVQSFSTPWEWNGRLFETVKQYAGDGFIVACVAKKPVAYIITAVEDNMAHIMSLAVLPDYRRKGIAEALILKSLSDVRNTVHLAYLEVRSSNKAAIALYRKLGFAAIGVVPRYYQDEGALVMATKI
jgi:ribosomal-protein-alanine N-acetyltransferase